MMIEVWIFCFGVDFYNNVNMQCELNSNGDINSSGDGDNNVYEAAVGNFDVSGARDKILKYRIV